MHFKNVLKNDNNDKKKSFFNVTGAFVSYYMDSCIILTFVVSNWYFQKSATMTSTAEKSLSKLSQKKSKGYLCIYRQNSI